jgi:hypothetical protein
VCLITYSGEKFGVLLRLEYIFSKKIIDLSVDLTVWDVADPSWVGCVIHESIIRIPSLQLFGYVESSVFLRCIEGTS